MVTVNDLYDCVVDGVYSFTTDQLVNLQDLINCAIIARENERLIDLQAKAINALKEYLKEGGELGYEDCAFLEIDESPEYDDDYHCIHFR